MSDRTDVPEWVRIDKSQDGDWRTWAATEDSPKFIHEVVVNAMIAATLEQAALKAWRFSWTPDHLSPSYLNYCAAQNIRALITAEQNDALETIKLEMYRQGYADAEVEIGQGYLGQQVNYLSNRLAAFQRQQQEENS